MKFIIQEVDRDYNAPTTSEIKEFDTVEEAAAYCKENTWSGYYYYYKILEN